MNLHVPQSYSSRVELQELAAVPYQIISPANNGAIIKLVQDSLLGYYLITDDKIRIDKRDMMNILMGVPNFNGILPKPHVDEGNKQLWTGKQLISIALPRINMSNSGIVIKNGELIKGRVGKGTSNAIIRVVYNDYGPKICQEYLDNIQNIVTRFLVKHGFSIGISDLIITDDVKKEIQDIIVEGKKEVLDLEKKVHLNIMTDIKKNAHDTFEATVRSIMSKTTEKVNKLYKGHLKDDNRAVMMKNAGSKGSDFNIQQMSTHLGQQIVQGKRVPIGYTDRTLPHYYRYDSDVISRGFVENSFMDGLTPQEAFFHAMGGREGLIDTAVKSVTGDTPIVIVTKPRKPSGMKNGRKFKRKGSIKYINIGEWIDKLLHENHDK
jgi:DNA-directed RNA polymerase II subunit RPB1